MKTTCSSELTGDSRKDPVRPVAVLRQRQLWGRLLECKSICRTITSPTLNKRGSRRVHRRAARSLCALAP